MGIKSLIRYNAGKDERIQVYVFLFSLLLLSSCTYMILPEGKQVVARVNGDPITVDDLKREFEKVHGGHVGFLKEQMGRRRFLDSVIDGLLLSQEGYRVGLDKDQKIVDMVARYRSELMVSKLLDEEVEAEVTVTDAEVREVYDRFYGRVIKVNYILLKTQEEAGEVIKELKRGRDFIELAQEKSLDVSAKERKKLRYIRWGTAQPEFEKAVLSLKVGEISDVVKAQDGYYIFKAEGEENLEVGEFPKVKEGIRGIIRKRKIARRMDEYLKELKGRHTIVINEGLLASGDENKVLVKVDGEDLLTVGEFNLELKRSEVERTHQSEIVYKRKTLERVITDKLLEQEAFRRGYEGLPEIVNKVNSFERGLVRDKLYGEIMDEVHISEDEVRSYYETHREDFKWPDKVRIRHILVKTEEEAQEILEGLQVGGDFDELARNKSIDPSASRGGDIGYFIRGGMIPEFEKAISSLNVGEIRGVVKTKFGYHILKLEEIKEGEIREFEEVKERVRNSLLSKKRKDNLNRWLEILRDSSKIEIYDDVLRAAQL